MKNYELVLPENCTVNTVADEQLVEGGGVYNSIVAAGINMVANGIFGGGTLSIVRNVVKSYGTTKLKSTVLKGMQKWVSARIANTLIGGIMGLVNGFLSFSVGDFAAKAWDRVDNKPNNGVCNWIS